jgi:O-antigen/teichoic acid export membrane protein
MVLASLPFLSLLINTAVGNQYLGAALPAQLILTGSAIWIGFFWLRPLFLAVGQVNLYTRLYLFSLLPYLVSFFYLMPKFGARGMAAGYLGHALLLLLIPGIRMLKCR